MRSHPAMDIGCLNCAKLIAAGKQKLNDSGKEKSHEKGCCARECGATRGIAEGRDEDCEDDFLWLA